MNQAYLEELLSTSFSFAAAVCANTLEMSRFREEAKRGQAKDSALDMGRQLAQFSARLADGFLQEQHRLRAGFSEWMNQQEAGEKDATPGRDDSHGGVADTPAPEPSGEAA